LNYDLFDHSLFRTRLPSKLAPVVLILLFLAHASWAKKSVPKIQKTEKSLHQALQYTRWQNKEFPKVPFARFSHTLSQATQIGLRSLQPAPKKCRKNCPPQDSLHTEMVLITTEACWSRENYCSQAKLLVGSFGTKIESLEIIQIPWEEMIQNQVRSNYSSFVKQWNRILYSLRKTSFEGYFLDAVDCLDPDTNPSCRAFIPVSQRMLSQWKEKEQDEELEPFWKLLTRRKRPDKFGLSSVRVLIRQIKQDTSFYIQSAPSFAINNFKPELQYPIQLVDVTTPNIPFKLSDSLLQSPVPEGQEILFLCRGYEFAEKENPLLKQGELAEQSRLNENAAEIAIQLGGSRTIKLLSELETNMENTAFLKLLRAQGKKCESYEAFWKEFTRNP
jgi:hypothetical protein